MASISQNINNNRYFKASTGLSMLEFETFYTYFEKWYLSKPSNPSLPPSPQPLFQDIETFYTYFEKWYLSKPSNPSLPPSPQPLFQDKREALFFILPYLKASPTLENMGVGVSEWPVFPDIWSISTLF